MTDDAASLARMENEMKHLVRSFDEQRKVNDDRWNRIEPVLFAKSGEEERDKQMKSDVNNLGGKVRDLALRVEKLEKWRDRAVWVFLGGVAVVQFLYQLAEPFIGRLLSSAP